MEICHLPTEKLRPHAENFFTPLPATEYEELKESISKHGIQQPLIVVPEENGFYTVISV